MALFISIIHAAVSIGRYAFCPADCALQDTKTYAHSVIFFSFVDGRAMSIPAKQWRNPFLYIGGEFLLLQRIINKRT